MLVSGSADDATGLVWDLSLTSAVPAKLNKLELAQFWDDLADRTDGGRVYQAMTTLADDPQGTVILFRQKIQPAEIPDPKHLTQLLVELDSAKFAVRKKALAELDRLGDDILGWLRAQLKKNPSLEMRRRLEALVQKHDPAELLPDRLRHLRALGRPQEQSVPQALP